MKGLEKTPKLINVGPTFIRDYRLHGTGVGAARGGVVNSNYANKDTRIDDPQTEKEETQSSLGLHWLWPCQLCTRDRS